MIKPPKLQPGDTIAVLSPSWGGPSHFPLVHENGIRVLEEHLGLRIKEYPTARMNSLELYQNPKLRAEDINNGFADPEVKGIIASIGGNDSIRILEYLDLDLILKNPKLIMGYSDSTAFLGYLNLMGLGTFYGPCTMAGFSYLENFPEAIEEYKRFLFEDSRIEISPFPQWADSYQSWGKPDSIGKVERIYDEHQGHHWINKGQPSTGWLWGGCFEVLEMMKATLAWPTLDFWENRVLFLETSEDKPTPEQVGYGLRNYGIQGALSKITGLLVGRPKAYSDEEKIKLDQVILNIVVGEFGRNDLTIVTNLDMGHTDPRHMFPYGIEIALDPKAESIHIIEEAFS
jgi:muramoyltetrapeptide carboxypeptidase LdcA involved in peptidoglycan recycling